MSDADKSTCSAVGLFVLTLTHAFSAKTKKKTVCRNMFQGGRRYATCVDVGSTEATTPYKPPTLEELRDPRLWISRFDGRGLSSEAVRNG